MKNTELLTIAKEALSKIFNEKEFAINVNPIKNNGAYICVKRIVNGEYWQVGFNCSVYAIAGKANVIKRINACYANRA